MALIFFVAQNIYSQPYPHKKEVFKKEQHELDERREHHEHLLFANKKGPPKAARIFLVKRKT
jgi:hypothetical protein